MIYYISDLHLGDQRVFDLCKRPFNSLREYEQCLIERWNKKVGVDDDVYILGDIALNSSIDIKGFLCKVNGHKHLIVGNHDETYIDDYSSLFVSIDKVRYIDDKGRKVCLCHYPIMDWLFGNEPIYHVYGHIHNKIELNNGYMYKQISEYYKDKKAYNASVDVTSFEPVTLDELMKLKEAK